MGTDDAVYVVARRSSEPLRFESNAGASFPKSRLDAATDYLAVRAQGADVRTAVVRGEALVVDYVQPFDDGLLLVAARCRWRADGPEQNAVVTGWDGQARYRLTLGDGLHDVRVSRDGIIWASYFDEGIFGNFGWGGPGPDPIGAAGLIAFNAEGDVRFRYDAADAGTDGMCDAYATCIANDGAVWTYFYTAFPIVRIVDGVYRVWNYGIGGAHAIAVRQQRALLFGDRHEKSLARVVGLGADQNAMLIEELVVTDDDGRALDNVRGCGAGERMFFFKDRKVLVLEDW